MQWVILIGDEQFDLNTLKLVKYQNCTKCYDVEGIKGRYCVEFDQEYIFYDYDLDISDYREDFPIIPYQKPHFIMMIYRSKKLVRNILQLKDFPNNIYVDNDYGIVLPITKFIEIGMPLSKDESIACMKN